MYWIGFKILKKNTKDLIIILNQLNLIDIYGILYPKTAEYIFFSSTYGTERPNIGQ